MTDLLSTLTRRNPEPAAQTASSGAGRPLVVGAAAAGVAAPAVVLLVCSALALAGWFASDGGSHGTTKDGLRVAADAWLLAHGARLALGEATVTALPLGLSLLCLVVAWRLGRWAALTCAVEDARTLGLGAVVLSGMYGMTAVLVAVLASVPSAQPHLVLAFAGGALVGLIGGGSGLAAGSGHAASWRSALPEDVAVALTTAAVAVLGTVAAGAVLVAGALLANFAEAADVLSRLHAGLSGGLLSVALVAAAAPNLALLGSAYLLGPGFAVGTGTLVAPSEVALGPVPQIPVLAALPPEGPAPWWAPGLVAVPVLVSLAGTVLASRAHPVPSYRRGGLRGCGGGVAAGLVLALLVATAGGAIGPGRMADIGAPFLDVLLLGCAGLGLGGLVGGTAAAWWARRDAAQ